MYISELDLNEIQEWLIAKYFSGVTPRPVKIDNSLVDIMALAGEPDMLFNASIHKSIGEAWETLIHELIHYELRDSGKDDGHGLNFKRRAKQLGILNRVELEQLADLERRAHAVEHRRVRLRAFADEIDKALEELADLTFKAPISVSEKIHAAVTNIKVGWACYRHAIEKGDDYVIEVEEEDIKEVYGRIHELLQEYKSQSDAKVLKELKTSIGDIVEFVKSSIETTGVVRATKTLQGAKHQQVSRWVTQSHAQRRAP